MSIKMPIITLIQRQAHIWKNVSRKWRGLGSETSMSVYKNGTREVMSTLRQLQSLDVTPHFFGGPIPHFRRVEALLAFKNEGSVWTKVMLFSISEGRKESQCKLGK